jgi:pimeloyl-ACP methyl ester carboxylesterase
MAFLAKASELFLIARRVISTSMIGSIQVDEIFMDLNVLRNTDDECLAILPGLLCDSRAFPGISGEIPKATIVNDFYNGYITLELMARHALSMLPPRFALLGHSMGARVALEIFRIAPERVTRVALVDTGLHNVGSDEKEKRYSLRDLGREQGIQALCDAWLPPMLAPASLADRALVESLQSMVCDAGVGRYEQQIEALLHRPRVDDVLARINVPFFAMVGEFDAWSPVSQHREIAAAVPGGQLRIVKGAGHMMPAEKPEEFHDLVREWLAWPTTPSSL